MTKILNFGSINVDHVYRVDHFVRPGETLSCREYRRFAGGKGLNQSIALAHAGASVSHAGKIGTGDGWLQALLQKHGVDATHVETVDGPSGHAIIQVNAAGENSIVIFGGANQRITEADAERVVTAFEPGDYLLLQNEISSIPEILVAAKKREMKIVLNPAPMTPEISGYPIDLVDLFVLNEIEAQELTNKSETKNICAIMRKRFPHAAFVLTQGKQGALYGDAETECHQPAEPVEAVDTTAAGDTFTGFFLAELIRSGQPATALEHGCRAAALCVTKPGASDSIPWTLDEETS